MRVNSILGAILLPAVVGLVLLAVYMGKAPVPAANLDSRTVHIGDATVQAEVADTDAEHAQGLSGRASLAPDAGMIFVFAAPGTYGFWMKEMRFPLDFVYVRDGRVVELKENVPVPTVALVPFFPEQPFDAVIEVNAGWIAAHGVKTGDKVNID